jgi:pyridoxine 5'-phosphate synthase PdxJ
MNLWTLFRALAAVGFTVSLLVDANTRAVLTWGVLWIVASIEVHAHGRGDA